MTGNPTRRAWLISPLTVNFSRRYASVPMCTASRSVPIVCKQSEISIRFNHHEQYAKHNTIKGLARHFDA